MSKASPVEVDVNRKVRTLVSLVFLVSFPLALNAQSEVEPPLLVEGNAHGESRVEPLAPARLPFTRALPGGIAHAMNQRSGLEIKISPGGTSFERTNRSEWSAHMKLARYGRPGAMTTTHDTAAHVDGERVDLEHSHALTEWYLNSTRGLEHGFTLGRRPEGDGMLRFEVDVQGARVTRSGRDALAIVSGQEVMRYEQLKAWDVDGLPLVASMRPSATGFVLDIDDSRARYPIIIDPMFVQSTRLTSNTPTLNGSFGDIVDVRENRIVVRTPYEEVNGLEDAGALYVFERDAAGAWGAPILLTSDVPQRNARFGLNVVVEGDMIIVSAPYESFSLGWDAGAVYVYERDPVTGWASTKLIPTYTQSNTWFGLFSLQATQDQIVIGAAAERVFGDDNTGDVYVYERSGPGAWALTRLRGSLSRGPNDRFGAAVQVVSDTHITVGAPGLRAVYVYEKDVTGTWNRTLSRRNLGATGFGTFVHATKDRIVTSAPQESQASGAMYVIDKDAAGVWGPNQSLRPDTPTPNLRFGTKFQVAGDLIVANVAEEPAGGLDKVGAVYAFEPDATGTWALSQKWTSMTPAAFGYFGNDIRVLEDMVVIDAFRDDVQGKQKAGAVYVYEKDAAGVWGATILNSILPKAGYEFGKRFEVTPDQIVIGASEDDVNSNRRAGAVYVYDRGAGGVWNQTRLISSDPASSFDFGASFRVYDERVVVQSFTQTINGLSFAGEVHIFDEISPGAWGPPRRLTSDTPTAQAQFGGSFGADGDLVVVGATREEVNGLFGAGAVYVFEDMFVLTANPDALTLDEDTSATIAVLANDEIDNATTVTGVANFSAGGSATVDATNQVIYTPAADFSGTETFEYTLTDGASSQTAQVTVTVSPINDPPVATAGPPRETDEDVALMITLDGTDVEDAANLLTFTAQDGANGRVSVNGQTATYTPDADYNGLDSFTYTVTDSEGAISVEATVEIEVNAINDAPSVQDALLTLTEDASLSLTLEGSDPEGDALTFRITSQPTQGMLSGTLPNMTYTPNTDFHGTDTFRFVVNDGALDAPEATVTLTVTPVNDAPIAQSDTVATGVGAAIALELTASDVDGDTLTFSVSVPANGEISGAAPNLVYTPNDGFEGQDTLTFTVSDGELVSGEANITIVVSDTPNVAPEFVEPTPQDDATLEFVEGERVTFRVVAQDADNGPMPLSLGLTGAPQASFDRSQGNVTWQTSAGDAGEYTLTISASDGLANTERTITLTILAPTTQGDMGTPDMTEEPGKNTTQNAGCCATAPSGEPRQPLLPVMALFGLLGFVRSRRRL